MKTSELRIGNDVLYNGELYEITCGEDLDYLNFDPIPLTEEWLLKFGFFQLGHFTVSDSWYINLGRNRQLSIGNINDANQMVFLQEIGKDKNGYDTVEDLICVWNFDYDGRINVHNIQNMFYILSNGQELVTSSL